ncbi:hypothetical protein M405DRAFT_717370, partial [Rhizopogon salebrosus TDB-379]
VPVPLGPALPRRDRSEARIRYCRLMLVFFKPWRHPRDLREAYDTWEEAFQNFEHTCHPRFRCMMNNIQLMHECKDSRDDH